MVYIMIIIGLGVWFWISTSESEIERHARSNMEKTMIAERNTVRQPYKM